MDLWVAAGWGTLGGVSLELLEILVALRRTGKLPWRVEGEPDGAAFLVSVVIRVVIGGGLTAAAATSDEICNPLAAYFMGATAPFILAEKVLPFIAPGRNGESAS